MTEPLPTDSAEPITEDWLKDAGFKWHQLERQPDKHWLLWLGSATRGLNDLTSYEDIGIEVAPMWFRNSAGDVAGDVVRWFCWLRGDSAGRYHRFIHIRHLATVGELVRLVEAITGQSWDPANNLYGSMRKPEDAARIRAEHDRLDRLILRENAKWADVERDDTRGRALPEHMEAAEKARKAGSQ